MSFEGQKFYPGEDATAPQVLMLADEYRKAAETLLPTGKRGKPLSRAPYRLVAIQAIELYLNALMLSRGQPSKKVRGLHHDMEARASFADKSGLNLRKGTIQHLIQMSKSREYVMSRYGAELTHPGSPLNRIAATLREVSEKVAKTIKEEAVTK
jgi:hypothetical protein